MANTILEIGPPPIESSTQGQSPALRASLEAQVASLQVNAVKDLFGPDSLGATFDTTA